MSANKHGWASISLMILLGIRLVGNVYAGVVAIDQLVLFVCVIMASLYLTALVGAYRRERWGRWVVLMLGVTDILVTATFMVGGEALAIVIYDMIIILLLGVDE